MHTTANQFENRSSRLRPAKASAPSHVLQWSVALALCAVVVGSTLAFIT